MCSPIMGRTFIIAKGYDNPIPSVSPPVMLVISPILQALTFRPLGTIFVLKWLFYNRHYFPNDDIHNVILPPYFVLSHKLSA